MSTAALLLPNQLFAQHPGTAARPDTVVLFEDPLFFGDAYYPATMHKQKLWLHRASMARYRDGLVAKGFDAAIWRFERQPGACLRLFQNLRDRGVSRVIMADPVDFIAERRFRAAAGNTDITLDIQPSPGFMNTRADNLDWSAGRKRWFMAEFYKGQRRRLNVLMDSGQPAGGQWSFDEENRKKCPRRCWAACLGSTGLPMTQLMKLQKRALSLNFQMHWVAWIRYFIRRHTKLHPTGWRSFWNGGSNTLATMKMLLSRGKTGCGMPFLRLL